jgi:hypothetical protein
MSSYSTANGTSEHACVPSAAMCGAAQHRAVAAATTAAKTCTNTTMHSYALTNDTCIYICMKFVHRMVFVNTTRNEILAMWPYRSAHWPLCRCAGAHVRFGTQECTGTSHIYPLVFMCIIMHQSHIIFAACRNQPVCVAHVHATCAHAAATLAHAAHGPPCRVPVPENHSHFVPTCMHSKWCLRVHTFSPTARLSVMSMHRASEAPAQARSQHGVACTGAQKSARALHIFMHICA